MARLNPQKLLTRFKNGTRLEEPLVPRCYTLTHSDRTGALFLTIAPEYDRKQISGWYTRLMRDEVLAEWKQEAGRAILQVHCHLSGGLVFGSARFRDVIFHRELPLVLEALRYGDRRFFKVHSELDQAPIRIQLHAKQRKYNRLEDWGVCRDYARFQV